MYCKSVHSLCRDDANTPIVHVHEYQSCDIDDVLICRGFFTNITESVHSLCRESAGWAIVYVY